MLADGIVLSLRSALTRLSWSRSRSFMKVRAELQLSVIGLCRMEAGLKMKIIPWSTVYITFFFQTNTIRVI